TNIGRARIDLTLPGNVETSVEAVITHHNQQLFLGMPFVDENEAIIDISGWIKLKGVWYCTKPHFTRFHSKYDVDVLSVEVDEEQLEGVLGTTQLSEAESRLHLRRSW